MIVASSKVVRLHKENAEQKQNTNENAKIVTLRKTAQGLISQGL